jgi:spermidine/putrescine transport system substrate-binding protein
MAFHPRENWIPGRGRMIDRRAFLRRAAMAGIAVPSLGAILAACGDDGTGAGENGNGEAPPPEEGGLTIGTMENPVSQPLFDDNPAIESGLEPEAGPLRIYNWADYLFPRVYKKFGEEMGVEVEVTTFYNEEEALRKLQSGELEVDVYFPTSEIVPKIVAGKLVQPLNHDYIPNLAANVWPMLADPFYDQGSQYGVPYAVYQTGIGYRVDMVDAADVETENPWDVFWNPEYKGIVGMYDDFEETLSAALFRNGVADPTNATQDELDQATEDLIQLVDLVNIRYTIDGAYAKLPEGAYGAHHAWSGDIVATPYYFPKGDDPTVTRYLWPAEFPSSTVGGLIANDTLAVTRNAQNPVLAHMFLNFMLEEENAMLNFSWVGYQPPLNSVDPDQLVADGYVPEHLESAIVTEDDFAAPRGVVPHQLAPEQEVAWLQAWSRVQAGG